MLAWLSVAPLEVITPGTFQSQQKSISRRKRALNLVSEKRIRELLENASIPKEEKVAASVVLKSMKLTRKEAKADSVEAQEMKEPVYPWGLQYSLNEEVLDKLGDSIDEYEVGEEYYLYAKCKVVGKSEREYENSSKSMCVDLQITDLLIEDTDSDEEEEDHPTVGSRLYGENK
jgi:hypothetical protein